MRRVAVVALALALLGACGEDGAGRVAAPTSPSAPASTTTVPAPTTPTTAAAPTTTTQPVLSVGETAFVDGTAGVGNSFSLRVHAYAQPSPAGLDFLEPSPGNEYAAADVEACTEADPTGYEGVAEPGLWSLETPEHARIGPVAIGGRKPELHQGTRLGANDCARGWVTFELPKGQRPLRLLYAAAPAPIRWLVPAAADAETAPAPTAAATAPAATARRQRAQAATPTTRRRPQRTTPRAPRIVDGTPCDPAKDTSYVSNDDIGFHCVEWADGKYRWMEEGADG